MTKIQNIALIAVLTLFSGCGTAVSDEKLFEFILPPKDTELIYRSKEGTLSYVRLLSFDKNEAVFEDRIEIPKSVQAALPKPLDGLGMKDGYLYDRYTYIFEENRIMRRDKEGDHILLKGPLQTSGVKWETRVLTIEEQVQNEGRAVCSIQEIKNKQILKQQRETITVDCIHEKAQGGSIIFRLRFARGIGIIEKSIHDLEEGGTSVSFTIASLTGLRLTTS